MIMKILTFKTNTDYGIAFTVEMKNYILVMNKL